MPLIVFISSGKFRLFNCTCALKNCFSCVPSLNTPSQLSRKFTILAAFPIRFDKWITRPPQRESLNYTPLSFTFSKGPTNQSPRRKKRLERKKGVCTEAVNPSWAEGLHSTSVNFHSPGDSNDSRAHLPAPGRTPHGYFRVRWPTIRSRSRLGNIHFADTAERSRIDVFPCNSRGSRATRYPISRMI